MAASTHLALALPDGTLGPRTPPPWAPAVWYVVAAGVAVYLVSASRGLSAWPAAIVWAVAAWPSTVPVMRARYVTATALGRQRSRP